MKKAFRLIGVLCLIALLSVTTKVGATEREESPVIVFDLEEIVITATRHPEPIKGISASVTIIDAEEIAEGGEITILESLRGLPGLDVVQTGGPGALTSVFLRGAAPRHTLVLVDGVKVNSPTTALLPFFTVSVERKQGLMNIDFFRRIGSYQANYS
ncbi:TonB-dependent receptor plug domain-containing protein [Thermodesulfovibrionales bacterium]|nr:TonB-dependent receptor plug domain-containing protein [Thermodesulfovibrionales bacterium]